MGMAAILEARGKKEDALKVYERALAIAPHWKNAQEAADKLKAALAGSELSTPPGGGPQALAGGSLRPWRRLILPILSAPFSVTMRRGALKKCPSARCARVVSSTGRLASLPEWP